jgi:hypothetical protein
MISAAKLSERFFLMKALCGSESLKESFKDILDFNGMIIRSKIPF